MSERERISHVVRRLSLGAHPERVDAAADVDDAIAVMLDLSAPPPVPPTLEPPRDYDEARDISRIIEPARWWLQHAVTTARPLEERMVWFWMDHFATGLRKVRSPDLAWRNHVTIRQHALGSFAELLRATATDGAMLVYLDGLQNRSGAINENYAREVMELHTMGRGSYTQADITEAARALSGWVVSSSQYPRAQQPGLAEGESYFVPFRHDSGTKTILGVTADHDLESTLGLLLDRPETPRFVASKLYRELVGTIPSRDVTDRLGATFGRDYSIVSLVEAIVDEPGFVSEEATRAKVRSPLEKVVGFLQATSSADAIAFPTVVDFFESTSYQPFNAPNPAGYPKGDALLGPTQLVHAFDLVALIGREGSPDLDSRDVLARLGIHDVAPETLAALDDAAEPIVRWALAVASPEYALV